MDEKVKGMKSHLTIMTLPNQIITMRRLTFKTTSIRMSTVDKNGSDGWNEEESKVCLSFLLTH
jgi:hypothetical protein